MKKAIKIVEDWSTLNKMLLNKNKCGILLFSKKGNTLTSKEWKINNENGIEGIKFLQNYKYLGINFNKSLNPKNHI